MGINVQLLVEELRDDARLMEENIRKLKDFLGNPESDNQCGNKGECIANAVLALRKLEEARMRLGEILRYLAPDEEPSAE